MEKKELTEFDKRVNQILDEIEKDGSVKGEDYDAFTITVKGTKHMIAVKAPNRVANDLIKDLQMQEKFASEKGDRISTDMYMPLVEMCLVEPNAETFRKIQESRPMILETTARVITALSLGGLGPAVKKE